MSIKSRPESPKPGPKPGPKPKPKPRPEVTAAPPVETKRKAGAKAVPASSRPKPVPNGDYYAEKRKKKP